MELYLQYFFWYLLSMFLNIPVPCIVYDSASLIFSLMLLNGQLSGRLLDETQVRAISDEIKNVIIASATRKRERTERTKAEDFDADEGELLKEENEQEEEVFDQVRLFWNDVRDYLISLKDVLKKLSFAYLLFSI